MSNSTTRKKIKWIVLTLLLGLIVFLSLPIVHLYKTYLKDQETGETIPYGYTNDESHLNLYPVDSIVSAAESKEDLLVQIRSLIEYAKEKQLPISIAGAKHSMGGHTITPNGILLNMRPYKQLSFDHTSNILTIGSGALWEDAIMFLDSIDKSVAVMQAFSSFSIGGSLSVNGHGWQKNSPPLGCSVISFILINAEGELLECSRETNAELFSLVLGGYGLFGIILDVKLKVVDNQSLSFNRFEVRTQDYLHYYHENVDSKKEVQLVFGRLRVSEKNFLEEATLNVFEENKEALYRLEGKAGNSSNLSRLVFRGSVDSEYGKRLRWDLENTAGKFSSLSNFTRNDLLNDDVKLIENKISTSTDILHEYFIPERNFLSFIEGMKKILPNDKINLLNITLRNVRKDEDSYLTFAKEDVIGFVLLFNQRKTKEHEAEMKSLTNQLVDLTLAMEGTFYLPYRLHIDREKMRKSYPMANSFFLLKLKYDPKERFSNLFYEHYK